MLGVPCHWTVALAAFSGALLGWFVISGILIVIERWVPPHRRH